MLESNFIDYVKIYFRSGRGGAGSSHLARTKYNPKAGPDGGNGGKGGDVIIRGNSQLWTLLHLKYTKHVIATDGESGGSNQRTGADGKDMIVDVPLGTIVRDAETKEIELEILYHDQKEILFPGGKGGLGNVNFKSSTNQTPRYSQAGLPGVEGWKILELKLLADVGLVGYPNAGKSTLLSVVSNARPKIANYPFTTLKPVVGIVGYRDNYSFVMADLPGIIEGASEGRGLGFRFLRHIERNSILLFVISIEEEDIERTYRILLDELRRYNRELLNKERIVVVTKIDLVEDSVLERIKSGIDLNVPVVYISSLTNRGIENLKDEIWSVLNNNSRW